MHLTAQISYRHAQHRLRCNFTLFWSITVRLPWGFRPGHMSWFSSSHGIIRCKAWCSVFVNRCFRSHRPVVGTPLAHHPHRSRPPHCLRQWVFRLVYRDGLLRSFPESCCDRPSRVSVVLINSRDTMPAVNKPKELRILNTQRQDRTQSPQVARETQITHTVA